MTYALAFTLHLLAVVIWVGGMFFAHFMLRPSAIEKLEPPVGYVDLRLRAFSEDETDKLMRQKFPDATRHDVQEFHRLSSQNPRVHQNLVIFDWYGPDHRGSN